MSSTGVEILSTAQAIKLPQSTAEKMPREMLVVTVSATDILVDGRKGGERGRGDGHRGRPDPDAQRPSSSCTPAAPCCAKENEAQNKSVTIMGDKEIPYSLLRKVMYTAARASFNDVSFAVSQKAVKT